MKFNAKDGGTIQVAVYNYMMSAEHSWLTVGEYSSEHDNDADRVRVSDPVSVSFKPLTNDAVMVAAVKVLDKQIENVNAEAGRKIRAIEEQKQKLLALTHQSEDVPA